MAVRYSLILLQLSANLFIIDFQFLSFPDTRSICQKTGKKSSTWIEIENELMNAMNGSDTSYKNHHELLNSLIYDTSALCSYNFVQFLIFKSCFQCQGLTF